MKRSDLDDVHVLALAARWRASGYDTVPGVIQALMDEGVPAKVARAKVEHLVSRGLMDYGVSPSFAWPTQEGLTLLRSSTIQRESIADALENDRCGRCLSVDHFREDCTA